MIYEAISHEIKISVLPVYLEDESNPDKHHFVWAYQIEIENLSEKTVQLRERYWKISNALGKIEEVHGEGVVGKQPVLEPGGKFDYTSGCPLGTSSGIMAGHYVMVNEEGNVFNVEIPAFSLDIPDYSPSLN